MKNLHILPTDKPSRLHLAFKAPHNYDPHNKELNVDRPKWVLYDRPKGSGKNIFAKNIYITSDEEIKEGEEIKGKWLFDKDTNEVFKCLNIIAASNPDRHLFKIILTTDQDLIKDGVQAIGDEFLTWFVKNPSCEKVEVIKQELNTDYRSNWKQKFYYKIIITKEEPKQYFKDIELPQQGRPETLEEAANNYSSNKLSKLGFINGAKWQQERSYSEEEVLGAFDAGLNYMKDGKLNKKQWFEQFKKK